MRIPYQNISGPYIHSAISRYTMKSQGQKYSNNFLVNKGQAVGAMSSVMVYVSSMCAASVIPRLMLA